MMKFSENNRRSVCALGILALGIPFAVLMAAIPIRSVQAHGTEARYVDFVNWPKENIHRIFGTNRTYFDGAEGGKNKPIQAITVEGKSCLMGDIIAFDIDDKFAFDIDEPVKLTLTYATAYSTPFVVAWDKSGGTGQGLSPEVTPTGGALGSVTLTLDRARFAGQGTQGSDVAIATKNGIALCDIKIVRSNTTIVPTEFGQVQLSIKDAKTGASVPARVGIYDSTGRAPLVSDKALMLQRFADDIRMLSVNERTFWPSENRQAFYADGSYQGKLPEGTYELVATRGPEFRAYHGKFEVKNGQTSKVAISLERYADMPKLGWYSGDGHIHLTRDDVADPVIWGMVAAEDVYVGNLLEMGNIAGTHFKQPKEWGKASRFERDGHFIVSGQEDPRTSQMGHTIHHNLQQPIHLPTDQYFLYNKVFEESKRQGGISGFAHMGWAAGNSNMNPSAVGQMNRGLVMLAPTGLVNFIEVLQKGRMLMDGWYRLLNLGYRINPDAGSDWPYSDFPGIVRNYVKLEGPFNLDNYYASFQAGHTFVTNGPLIDFTVNGRGMGEEIRVKKGAKLDFVASAQLNPDVDKLDRLELVVLGDVAQTLAAQGKDRVAMHQQMTAEHSMWVAIRAYGSRQEPANTVIAHSAPIYVVVDDEPTWKREEVPTIVAELRERLQRILTDPLDATAGIGEASPNDNADRFETRMMLDTQWLLQRPLLKPQVDAADASYQKLLVLWSKFSGMPPTASAGASR
jgi:hypothetical protein